MFTKVHSARIAVVLSICALVAVALLPQITFSQETSLSDANREVGTTSPTKIGTAGSYPTEKIIGDADVGDFVVGPGKVDVTLDSGQTRTIEMTVTNRTGETRMFSLDVEDAKGSESTEQTIILLGDDRGPYSLKDYIAFPYETFELAPGDRARIPVTIRIPADADPGGLYGSVLVKTTTAVGASGDQNTAPRSAIVARIGTLFFVTVAGEVEHAGALKKFTVVPEKKYFQRGPINFGILFENTGPIHLTPYGEISITNMLGEEVDFIELDPWFVLPQSLRLREVEWGRALLFGRYTATIKINRSYDDIIDAASVTFWVMPWQWLLGAFIIIFGIFFLMRSFFKTFEFRRKS